MSISKATATFFGATDTGMKRTNNEDNFIACEIWGGTHLLLAAIDGIGGYEGGEVAAQIARDTIVDEVTASDVTDCLQLLKSAVTKANNSIVEHKSNDAARSRMGCVISSAIISLPEQRLYMVHVGDSRLYRYTAAEGLKKLSHDHSLVGYREEIGMLTEEQAMTHPQRNIIERSLGEAILNPDNSNFLDAGIFPILESSKFLLCSDGLSDMLYSAEIASVMMGTEPASIEVKRLIDMANDAGGKDNITAVVAHVSIPSPDKAPHACGTTAFGSPLTPADNSDDFIASPCAATAPEHTATQNSGITQESKIKRFKSLLIFSTILFIISGSIGFFIGHTTAPEPEIQIIRDTITVVTSGNDPDSLISDSTRVGEHVADSTNSQYQILMKQKAE